MFSCKISASSAVLFISTSFSRDSEISTINISDLTLNGMQQIAKYGALAEISYLIKRDCRE